MATVNKQAIAAAFGRAAAHYEQHADLQRQSADALLAMLPQRKYTHVLDAGCGPGWMSRHWRERHAQVTALDLSPPMLVQARQKDAADHYLAGDIESLPLATATFDLAWSNLAVQWCGNLSTALRELYRVVRPKGVVAFTTLVQGSLASIFQFKYATPGQVLHGSNKKCRHTEYQTQAVEGIPARFFILFFSPDCYYAERKNK